MTESTAIKPDTITKPIQLLGAWLAGLFSIDSCFLFAASTMQPGSWEGRALVIAAISNVPLFLLAVFLLQTRFRPEMQEDSYYSSYLSRKTNVMVSLNKEDLQFAQVQKQLQEIEARVTAPAISREVSEHPLASLIVGVNKLLPDKGDIASALAKVGVVGYRPFGTNETPPGRIVGVSQGLSKDVTKAVLEVSRELGFTHYSTFNQALEEMDEEVLFGAYGVAEYELTGGPAH